MYVYVSASLIKGYCGFTFHIVSIHSSSPSFLADTNNSCLSPWGYLGFCPLSRIFLGTIVTLMEPPFLSSRIGLTISAPVLPLSDAKHCSRSRKRLQPPLQSIATVPANVCGKTLHLASVPASTCNRLRKYVHPSLQVRASEIGFI